MSVRNTAETRVESGDEHTALGCSTMVWELVVCHVMSSISFPEVVFPEDQFSRERAAIVDEGEQNLPVVLRITDGAVILKVMCSIMFHSTSLYLDRYIGFSFRDTIRGSTRSGAPHAIIYIYSTQS